MLRPHNACRGIDGFRQNHWEEIHNFSDIGTFQGLKTPHEKPLTL